MSDFDPALTGSADDGIYGIATTVEEAMLVYVPVPWEVTTSYGNGTSRGPDAILRASPQLDLFVRGADNHYQRGFHLLAASDEIIQLNASWKPVAEQIQEELEQEGKLTSEQLLVAREEVNRASERVNELVYQQCRALGEEGKLLAVIGGDHSSPYGLVRYLAEKHTGDFSILHIDAHLDLRDAYQGFQYSHASIMRNLMALPRAPRGLVQVGIRDFCEDEARFAATNSRIQVFYDEDIKSRLYEGETFATIVNEIIAALPTQVYISFDIDGLRPDLCPHTGTPVAGGLEFEQAQYLIKALARSGRRIIGFDLCEVSPNPDDATDEWDGNVGARVLFMLSTWMMESQKER